MTTVHGPAVSNFVTRGRPFFVKKSHDAEAELTHMRIAREALPGLVNGYRIVVPEPFGQRGDRVIQEKLEGFQTLGKVWIEAPDVGLSAIEACLKALEALKTVKVEKTAETEITTIETVFLQHSYQLHHLTQEYLRSDVVREIIRSPYKLTKRPHLIHGDFKPDNILVRRGDHTIAIVDWEASGSGDSVLDLASLLSGLLYISTYSAMGKTKTNWESLNSNLKRIGALERSRLSGAEERQTFRTLLAKYLIVRINGHLSEVEQNDRCSQTLMQFVGGAQ